LVFFQQSGNSGRNLVLTPSDGAAEFPSTRFDVAYPQFSPDGRWIAYAMFDSDQAQVMISRYPETGAAIQISNDGGVSPTWSHDGREVLYVSDGEMFAVRVDLGNDDPGPSEPVKLMDFAHDTCGPVRCFDIAPDGRFLVIDRLDEESQTAIEAFYPDRIRIVQNWFTELIEKVPVAP
jgi:hypothetical protein